MDTQALLRSALAAMEAGDVERALSLCESAAAADPDDADAWRLTAFTLVRLGRQLDSLSAFQRAIELAPEDADTLSNQACALHDLGRHDQALAACDRAIAVRPTHAAAHFNRGLSLRNLQRSAEALESFERAIALSPEPYPDALAHRIAALLKLDRFAETVRAADDYLHTWAQDADIWWARGAALRWLNRPQEALASFRTALELDPRHPDAFNGAVVVAMALLADWEAIAELRERFEKDPWTIANYPSLAILLSDDPAVHRQCAERHITAMRTGWPANLSRRPRTKSSRIRLAYVSADFRKHPVGFLFQDILARSDRDRFEVHGVALNPDDGCPVRSALAGGFDAFHDVSALDDRDAAEVIAGIGADIAVDIMGHTNQARPALFAGRPAPVQVNYLGYPGTTGADFIDYILADRVVLPFEDQPYCTEAIVHLPACYLPGVAARRLSDKPLTRPDMGLPEYGFVFCCFNALWKITPDVFAQWMGLLGKVDGSVLWLSSSTADETLKRRAGKHGVDPDRVIFKPRLPFDEHLSAYRLADLFLDTLPYNAHATALDAVWAGLPLLTRKGGAFAGRVGASVLQTVGVPELITATGAEYEALALALADDPDRLASYRQTLARNRNALFDGESYVRALEGAFAAMHARWRLGQPPANFAV